MIRNSFLFIVLFAATLLSQTRVELSKQVKGSLPPSNGGTGLSSCAENEVLVWQSGAFVCSPSSAGPHASDHELGGSDRLSLENIDSSLLLGSLPFLQTGRLGEDNSNLFWDDTNNILGVGINSGFTATRINISDPGPSNWGTFTGHHDSVRAVINGYPQNKQLGAGNLDLLHGVVGAIEVPSTAIDVDGIGVGGYARSADSASNTVGVVGLGRLGAAGAKTWGGNFVAEHGGFAGEIWGIEIDLVAGNSGSPPTVARGLVVVSDIQHATPPADFAAVKIAVGPLGKPFEHGLLLGPGGAKIGIELGAEASGNSQDSQELRFRSTNSTGGTLKSHIWGTDVGRIAFDSDLEVNKANAGVELGSVSASNTPFLDFHSSGNNIGYDFRLLATGGTGTAGQGSLQMFGDNLELRTKTQLFDQGSQPACNVSNRFMLWVDQGGAGVKDSLEICAKDGSDSYAWRLVY